jgi:hypothetical protein
VLPAGARHGDVITLLGNSRSVVLTIQLQGET